MLGTGPGLAAVADSVRALRDAGKARVFGVNNTYLDFRLDVWIACDPHWHDIYALPRGLPAQTWCFHWSQKVAKQYGYYHIRGRWAAGLSTDPRVLHYGHSSTYQALGLALHFGCRPLVLVGCDMQYEAGAPRHYFSGLSDQAGEYPEALRKFSRFDGLIKCYESIAGQSGLPSIYNATPGSALRCFPIINDPVEAIR